jgi:hypothetical protein
MTQCLQSQIKSKHKRFEDAEALKTYFFCFLLFSKFGPSILLLYRKFALNTSDIQFFYNYTSRKITHT